MTPRTDRRRAVFRTASGAGALVAAAVTATAFAPAAGAAAGSGTVPYTCTTIVGPNTVTSVIGLTVPATAAAGGTLAVGAIKVTPGAFAPPITTPVAMTSTVQDTLSLTVTSSGGGTATIDVVGAVSASQTVGAGGSPTNPPFSNTKAIPLPASLAAGTLSWKAGKQVLTAQTNIAGTQTTNCVLDAAKANPVLTTSTLTAAAGGGPTTSPSSGRSSSPSSHTSSPAPGDSGSSAGDLGGSSPSGTATQASGTLPHTGFNGLWLAGGAAGAAALGGVGLYATRRRSAHS